MRRKLLLFVGLLFAAASLHAQEAPLPQDPSVRMGKLKNGLTYYIRHNAKEPGLADFYIAQRVGSIQEEPRQRGLAHFLEHMAFNGTKNFPGKGKRLGIVPWCETIGVKFGANLNAYTSIDQTVYHIGSAPLKREGIIDSCLLVLHDWSHYLLLEDAEIDKERGVIHEEWRTRRAGRAVQRLMEEAMPKVYKGTKYEDCMPIGSMDIVDNFPYQDLRDYYNKWYRPDLQAIIVVGDIDVDKMEKKIKKLFSPIPMPKNAAERIDYPVNDNDSMIVCIEKDKEQPIVLCHLYMKRPATPDSEKNNEAYLRGDYVDGLISTMLNSRLNELKTQAVPPFQSCTGRASDFFLSRTKEAFSLSISCKQENILGGIISAVAAAEQARQQGFTQEELDRAKLQKLGHDERKWNERNDRINSKLVSLCVQNFLTGEPLISIDKSWELTQKFDREVTLDEVNQATRDLITDQNQVVIMYAPDKETVKLPSEQQIEDVILATQRQHYAPRTDEVVDDQLFAKGQEPVPGTIVSEKPWKHGYTELVLSNGMKLYVRSTDFNQNTVQLTMKAEGGTSGYSLDDLPHFGIISSAVTEGGVGQWDAITLRKKLTGKSVRVQTSVGSRQQTISGGASLKDVETMFQLAYLYFTSPRRDTVAWQGFVNRNYSFLNNRNASPRVDYNDSISAILYGHHPRTTPMTQERLAKADYDRILEMYRNAFSDASQFKATIIGNMSLDELRPLITKYLASLPATTVPDVSTSGVNPYKVNEKNLPQFVKQDVTRTFRKKMATPLANVSIFYAADVDFTPRNDLILDVLKRTLSIAYTDSVREEKGGTYGVSVDFDLDKDDTPDASLRISYNADPDRYEELNPIVYGQMKAIADKGPVPTSLAKVKEYLVKQYDQVAITNDYWNYVIWHELDDDADFDTGYKELVQGITAQDVQQMAQRLMQSGYRIEVTMLSE
ncbi:MAG: insulinase family protein [Prevotella sp.]|nr:insulinase family protein [Prevotella sp.]